MRVDPKCAAMGFDKYEVVNKTKERLEEKEADDNDADNWMGLVKLPKRTLISDMPYKMNDPVP